MSRMLALFPLGRHTATQAPKSFAEVHVQLARQHYAAERYKLARRHFRAAIRFAKKDPDSYVGLARAWEDDPYGSDERAYLCYRRAVKLDRSNAANYACLARSASRTYREATAKKAIEIALRLAPADAVALAVVIETLREMGRSAQAWRLICQARFLAPQDKALRDLWSRVKFDLAAKDYSASDDDTAERIVLPFLRIVNEAADGKWRLDTGNRQPPQFDC